MAQTLEEIEEELRKKILKHQGTIFNVIPAVANFLGRINVKDGTSYASNNKSIHDAFTQCQVVCTTKLSELIELYNDLMCRCIDVCGEDSVSHYNDISNDKIRLFIKVIKEIDEKLVENSPAFKTIIKETEDCNEKLENLSAQFEENLATNARLQSQNQSLKAKILSLEGEIDGLKRLNDSLIEKAQDSELLQQCNEEKDQIQQTLQNQIELLQAKVEEVVAVQALNEDLRNTLTTKNAEIMNLQSDKRELQELLSQTQKEREICEESTQTEDRLSDSLKLQLENIKGEREELRRKIEALEAALEDEKRREKTFEMQIEQKQDIILPDHEHQKLTAVLEQQVKDVSATNKKQAQEIQNLKNTIHLKDTEIEEYHVKDHNNETLINTLRKEILDLNQKLAEKDETIRQMEENCEDIQGLFRKAINKLPEIADTEALPEQVSLLEEIAEKIAPEPWEVKRSSITNTCIKGIICNPDPPLFTAVDYVNESAPAHLTLTIRNNPEKGAKRLILSIKDGFKPSSQNGESSTASISEATFEFIPNNEDRLFKESNITLILHPSGGNGKSKTHWQFIGSNKIALFLSIMDFNPTYAEKQRSAPTFEVYLEVPSKKTQKTNDCKEVVPVRKYIRDSVNIFMNIWAIDTVSKPNVPVPPPLVPTVTTPKLKQKTQEVGPKRLVVAGSSSDVTWSEAYASPNDQPKLTVGASPTLSSEDPPNVFKGEYISYSFNTPILPKGKHITNIELSISTSGNPVLMEFCKSERKGKLDLFKNFNMINEQEFIKQGALINLRIYPYDPQRMFPRTTNISAVRINALDVFGNNLLKNRTLEDSNLLATVLPNIDHFDIDVFLCENSKVIGEFDKNSSYIIYLTGTTDIVNKDGKTFKLFATKKTIDTSSLPIVETVSQPINHSIVSKDDTKHLHVVLNEPFFATLDLDPEERELWKINYPNDSIFVLNDNASIDRSFNHTGRQVFTLKATKLVPSSIKFSRLDRNGRKTTVKYEIMVHPQHADKQDADEHSMALELHNKLTNVHTEPETLVKAKVGEPFEVILYQDPHWTGAYWKFENPLPSNIRYLGSREANPIPWRETASYEEVFTFVADSPGIRYLNFHNLNKGMGSKNTKHNKHEIKPFKVIVADKFTPGPKKIMFKLY